MPRKCASVPETSRSNAMSQPNLATVPKDLLVVPSSSSTRRWDTFVALLKCSSRGPIRRSNGCSRPLIYSGSVSPMGKPFIPDTARVDQAIAKLKALRKGCTLGGLSWKALREEGRPQTREALPGGQASVGRVSAPTRRRGAHRLAWHRHAVLRDPEGAPRSDDVCRGRSAHRRRPRFGGVDPNGGSVRRSPDCRYQCDRRPLNLTKRPVRTRMPVLWGLRLKHPWLPDYANPIDDQDRSLDDDGDGG